jgi:hypothetical protein
MNLAPCIHPPGCGEHASVPSARGSCPARITGLARRITVMLHIAIETQAGTQRRNGCPS